MPSLHPLHAQVATALQTRNNIPVNATWLNVFLNSRGGNPPPLPALISTAHFRILASDITTSITPGSASDVFTPEISDVNVKERVFQGTVIVQVLDVLDVGMSKWNQLEAIERVERGEEIRGREVIRTVNGAEEDEGDAVNGTAAASMGSTSTSNTNPGNSKKITAGPHKLLLQDARGTKALAFELSKIPRIGIFVSAGAVIPASLRNQAAAGNAIVSDDPGMFIGCKLLLRAGTVIRRGMVMLTPDKCTVLGGKVEAWDKKWKEGRKQTLTALIVEEHAARN